jgi:hypothetical protein
MLRNQESKTLSRIPESDRNDAADISIETSQTREMRIRRCLRLSETWPDALRIHITHDPHELEIAFRLLHDSYVRAGFMKPEPSGMRILPQHRLPQTSVAVVKWDERVIGTFSFIGENPMGLPMEKIFDLNPVRSGGRRLIEISSLAIDPSFRGGSGTVLFPICRFVYQYSRWHAKADDAVIAVNPSMEEFYQSVLLFQKLGDQIGSYDFVNGAPAVGFRWGFDDIEERWESAYSGYPSRQNIWHYFTDPADHPGNGLQWHRDSSPIEEALLLRKGPKNRPKSR